MTWRYKRASRSHTRRTHNPARIGCLQKIRNGIRHRIRCIMHTGVTRTLSVATEPLSSGSNFPITIGSPCARSRRDRANRDRATRSQQGSIAIESASHNRVNSRSLLQRAPLLLNDVYNEMQGLTRPFSCL